MAQLERRAAIAAIAMLAAAGSAAVANPRRRLANELPPLDLEANVPSRFGAWNLDQAMVPVLPAPDVQERMNKLYNSVLSRTYTNGKGYRIMFLVAYGADQANRETLAHLPEACYPAQGFEIWPRVYASVPVIGGPLEVVRLRTRKGTRVEPVTYWTTVGDRTLVNEVSRRFTQARYSLFGVIPDGMLVRVSSIDDDETGAFEVQSSFVTDLCNGLAPATRARLFGARA